MEILATEQTTLENPSDHPAGIEGLTCETFAALAAMSGLHGYALPCHEEIFDLLENLDLFTRVEYEHMLRFIHPFLARISRVIVESIRHYLNELSSEDTIEFFIRAMAEELEKVRSSFYGTNPFESLLALYLLNLDRDEII